MADVLLCDNGFNVLGVASRTLLWWGEIYLGESETIILFDGIGMPFKKIPQNYQTCNPGQRAKRK